MIASSFQVASSTSRPFAVSYIPLPTIMSGLKDGTFSLFFIRQPPGKISPMPVTSTITSGLTTYRTPSPVCPPLLNSRLGLHILLKQQNCFTHEYLTHTHLGGAWPRGSSAHQVPRRAGSSGQQPYFCLWGQPQRWIFTNRVSRQWDGDWRELVRIAKYTLCDRGFWALTAGW